MRMMKAGILLTVGILLIAGILWMAITIANRDGQNPKDVAVLDTQLGRIVFEFFPEVAPKHCEAFKALAHSGFYDGTTFHRVIPGFMIQGGDPNSKDDDRSNDGMGNPGYTLPAEFNDKPHLRGTVSMARTMDPNSAGSQFFICVASVPHLDRQYTVFGQVIEGLEVIDKIVAVPRDPADNPLEPVHMQKARVVKSDEL